MEVINAPCGVQLRFFEKNEKEREKKTEKKSDIASLLKREEALSSNMTCGPKKKTVVHCPSFIILHHCVLAMS